MLIYIPRPFSAGMPRSATIIRTNLTGKGAEKKTPRFDLRIILVRHGETDWNRENRLQGRMDIPLNQKGKVQADALALALKDEALTAIYSSPLVRAMETARSIRRSHPFTPLFEERGLVDMSLGDFDGIEFGQWASDFPDFYKAWQTAPACLRMPGGETLQDVQKRAIETLDRAASLHPSGSTLLLCSHNFVNRTLLCHALEIPLNRYREIHQHAGALNILYQHEGQLRAEVVDDLSHLAKYEGESRALLVQNEFQPRDQKG